MSDKSFIGVVLGGDMNSYAVARAFYEAYGIKTVIVGQRPIFPTRWSHIVEGHYYPGLLQNDVLVKAMEDINALYPDKTKIVFGNTDFYVRHIIVNREAIQAISPSFLIPICQLDLYDRLFDKASFYQLCEKYGLPHPRTVVYDFSKDSFESFTVPFEYPVFFKATDSVEFSHFSFEGKQKGYKVDSPEQLKKIISDVSGAGYKGTFALQEYIEGDDDSMYVYSAYVNSKHKTVAMTGGKILMHDRTPELIGNYNAISNAHDEALAEMLRGFLDRIAEDYGFTGICHFDVQYDAKRQGYVIFEMNIRQGRSNYYTTASGVNFPKLIVEDYLEHKDQEYFLADKKFVVSVVPKSSLKKVLEEGGSRLDPEAEFFRFYLAPYDRGIKRSLYQLLSDRKTMSAYHKYNEKR